MPHVSILGSGYVGLCSGVVLAERGHNVTLVDVDLERVDAINAGQASFHEPGLDEALARLVDGERLEATTAADAAVDASSITYVCVGTPQDDDGEADLSAIRQAARDVGEALAGRDGDHVVVVKSTVPPGTTRDVVREIVEEASGRGPEEGVHVAMNPEFLREGSALADAREPDRVVVGADRERAAERVWSLFEELDTERLTVDPTTAETIKYANNAFLATKVGLSNELANISEQVGADWEDVAEGVGLDDRIEHAFMRAGAGFGGSCFPKDVAAIEYVSRREGVPSGILQAVLEGNQTQPIRAVDLLEGAIGELDGRRIALLGLAFKPGTDDVRETRAAPIYDRLVESGATVVCHDPKARETFREVRPDAETVHDVEAALHGADGCIVQTAWPRYAKLTPAAFAEHMEAPVVVDGRRALDEDAMLASSVTYRAIGLGHR
jgi:UDPglucose 6-dehydrogenase